MEPGGDDLDGHQHGDDGDDHPDAPTVGDGPGQDRGGLPLEGDEEPRQRIDQEPAAAAQGQQDERDPDQGGVDAVAREMPPQTPADHPGRLGAAEGSLPVPAVPAMGPGTARCPTSGGAPRPVPGATPAPVGPRPSSVRGGRGVRRSRARSVRGLVGSAIPDDRAPRRAWLSGTSLRGRSPSVRVRPGTSPIPDVRSGRQAGPMDAPTAPHQTHTSDAGRTGPDRTAPPDAAAPLPVRAR